MKIKNHFLPEENGPPGIAKAAAIKIKVSLIK